MTFKCTALNSDYSLLLITAHCRLCLFYL